MRKLISVFLAVSMLASLASCGNENAEQNTESVSEKIEEISEETVPETEPPTEPPTDPPTEPPTDPPTEAPTTAIEALHTNEKNIFDALKDFSSAFYDPSSMKLLDIKSAGAMYLKVSGDNLSGWISLDLDTNEISKSPVSTDIIETISSWDYDSVKRINNALQEYFG